jgi:hypothetical protein
MRLRALAACGVLLVPGAVSAQQGAIHITGAAHSLSGDPARIGTQATFEPDVGVSWLRPGTRFGTLQIEIRGTTRDDLPHVGRAFVSLRDFHHAGVAYTFEAGDSFFSTSRGDYQLRNLYTPAVNFSGFSAQASTKRTAVAVMAGRATATRNIFGTDTETLDQDLIIARGSRELSDRLQVTARASRIRTRDLREFTFTIADSDQAGGGARFILTPAVHLVADGSVVTYRRRDATDSQTDGSVLTGASLLLARGWLQANASRFSPGELPILAQPLADRQTWYAAGEYDVFRRIRLFGGWESFRANLDRLVRPNRGPTDGSRSFGGVRIPLGGRSSAALRVEQGDRRTRLLGASLTRVSDTGVMSAEWQTTLGPMSAFARFARRDNVESDYQAGTYRQNEGSGLAFVNLTRNVQLFSSATGRRNTMRNGGGDTFWQFGGGAQSRVLQRSLWFRAEALASHNVDITTDRSVPQRSFSLGLNGEIRPNLTVALSVYADRPFTGSNDGLDSWLMRSSVRITRSFPMGPTHASRSLLGPMARHGGTGAIEGLVYADWNGNGLQEPGELPLEHIPIRIASLAETSTSRAGEFAFLNVPIGLLQIGIDIPSLPVDFDAPQVPQVQVDLRRGETRRLVFGLVPLGSLGGHVVRDLNENGILDQDDTAVEDAVLVLDGGTRTEKVRGGQFRFDAVPSGAHTVSLLPESLPEDSTIIGPASVELTIGMHALAPETVFLVRLQERPEIRRVFPRRRAPEPPAATAPFAIRIAWFGDAASGTVLVEELRTAGFAAYLVQPAGTTTNAGYEVRVGLFETQEAAEQEARVLEKRLGTNLRVITAR